MSLLGIDLGGTKVAFAIFSKEGELLQKDTYLLGKRRGNAVGNLMTETTAALIDSQKSAGDPVESIGVSVPGISHSKTGTVWAPNIKGWEDYPLLEELLKVASFIPVKIDSDRACSILGELWQGNARGCLDAIFLTVGTGIGAGILANGEILRGNMDIAGAIGWMGFSRPYQEKYSACGCFEYYASGAGIARNAEIYRGLDKDYRGELSAIETGSMSAQDVFAAYDNGDKVAIKTVSQCIGYWGMAAANLVSLFNPEKIIFGGGIFGPATRFLPEIKSEAEKWGQPVSMKHVSFETSALLGDAAVFGAGCLALRNAKDKRYPPGRVSLAGK